MATIDINGLIKKSLSDINEASDGDRTHNPITSSPYANFQTPAKETGIIAGAKKLGKTVKELAQDNPKLAAAGAAGAAGLVGAGVMAKKYLNRKKQANS